MRSPLCFRLKGHVNCVAQLVGRQLLVWNRNWARTGSSNDLSPELLISKKRNNDSRASERESGCCCTRTSVMNDTRYLTEKPVVWNTPDDEDVFCHLNVVRSEIAPALRNDGALAGLFHRVKHGLGQFALVVDDN